MTFAQLQLLMQYTQRYRMLYHYRMKKRLVLWYTGLPPMAKQQIVSPSRNLINAVRTDDANHRQKQHPSEISCRAGQVFAQMQNWMNVLQSTYAGR